MAYISSIPLIITLGSNIEYLRLCTGVCAGSPYMAAASLVITKITTVSKSSCPLLHQVREDLQLFHSLEVRISSNNTCPVFSVLLLQNGGDYPT